MTTIVTREVGATAKGSPLTNAELDNNFINLNTNKVETADFNVLARPSIRPSLLLDFANSKQLDPRITFTRASTATYWDGNTQELAEQNLLTYSQEFANGRWGKANGSPISTTAIAPDLTTTASELKADAVSDLQPAIIHHTLTVTGTYTYSIFVKRNTQSYIQFWNATGADTPWHATFDINSGVVGSSNNCTPRIQSAGDGWYRCIVTATKTGTTGSFAAMSFVPSASAVRAALMTTNGTESVYIWGAQLEQRSQVTAYTPTTDQPITKYQPVLQTAASGVPRFDHDPVTGESLGLLIEEQRTNLLTGSENPAWADTIAGTSTKGLAGWGMGFNVFEVKAKSAHGGLRRTIAPLVSGQVYTLSFYMKSTETVSLILENGRASYGTWTSATITGATGVIYNVLGFTSATSKPFGGGYLYTFVLAAAGGGLIANLEWQIVNNGGRMFLGRPQFEAGAFPSSYIPTTAAQATRAADSARMLGTNFSSWYRQGEGTLFASGNWSYGSELRPGNRGLAVLGESGDRCVIYNESGKAGGVIVQKGGVTQAFYSGALSSSDTTTVAIAMTYNDSGYSRNGDTSLADTSFEVPSVSYLGIGNASPVLGFLGGYVKKIAYYPKRLSNTELQALTA